MERLGPGGRDQAVAFLMAMIDPEERERIAEWIWARSGRDPN